MFRLFSLMYSDTQWHIILKDNLIFLIAGDQIGSEAGQSVFLHASDVVQVSAAPLLRPVVYLLARICQQLPLQGPSSAHGLWCAEEDAREEAAGARWGRTLLYMRRRCRHLCSCLFLRGNVVLSSRCVTVCCCSCAASTANQSWPSGCCLRWRRPGFSLMLLLMDTTTRCVLFI